MSDGCSRRFEVEAMRDGRLTGASRVRFERHLVSCTACAAEAQALDDLADAVRVMPERDGDELRTRRERNRLLAAFDLAVAPPDGEAERRWTLHRQVLTLAAVSAIAAGVFVFFRKPTTLPAVPIASSVVVRADGETRYTTRREGRRETIDLERGALRVQVEHAHGEPALLIRLPDGELEDTGTIFRVVASGGRTTYVAVEEGSVLLRLHGQAPIAIAAGESWSHTTAPASVPSPSASEAKAPPAGAPTVALAPPPPDASEDFRAAMTAWTGGDNRTAERKLARFLAAHPRDPRAEDAAYLRVIALDRLGDAPARRIAAAEYLRRFPSGFRRAEVESLGD